jgi:hypothetical protein
MTARLLVHLVSRVSKLYQVNVFWAKLHRALALHSRGEVRRDGLQITVAKTTLRVEWLARDIHPWDRKAPLETAERLFREQCLDDTDAAITRLFAEIPILNSIEVCVRRTASGPPLISGTVDRQELRSYRNLSTGMRLRSMGLFIPATSQQIS